MKVFFGKDRNVLAMLLLIWTLGEFLINPVGEFPLNDDWSYTLSLKHLYETGGLKLTGFTSMPLVAQLYWALPFCKLFGFSFTVIRFSTLILAFTGIACTYFFLKTILKKRHLAFMGALFLLVNPIFLNLSNTFMTDIPFLTGLMAALLCFILFLQRGRISLLIAAIVCVTLCTLVRQLGLLAAASFSLAYLLRKEWKWQSAAIAFFTVAVPLAAYLGFSHWLRVQELYPVMYDEGIKQIKHHFFHSDYPLPAFLGKQVFYVFIYSGLFIFPLIFLLKLRQLKKDGNSLWWCLLLPVVLVAGYFFAFGIIMPYMGNIITPYGLGIIAMRDIMILKIPNLEQLPVALWLIITLMSVAGTGLIFYVLLQQIKTYKSWGIQIKQDPGITFLVIFVFLYVLVMILGGAFDRYLLPILPAIFVLLVHWFRPLLSTQKKAYLLVAAALLIFFLFSVSLTRDYLSWNRARWKALGFLTKEWEISPGQIDGGFEFNGFYLYNNTPMVFQEDPLKKSWWWVKDDLYLVSFGPVPGYEKIASYSYGKCFNLYTGQIYILKRQLNTNRQ